MHEIGEILTCIGIFLFDSVSYVIWLCAHHCGILAGGEERGIHASGEALDICGRSLCRTRDVRMNGGC